jgi:hypothetical protein
MSRNIILCLAMLIVAVTAGCKGDVGAKAYIDTDSVRWGPLAGWIGCPPDYCGFIVPVIVTPASVPSAGVAYSVELYARDGYSFGTGTARWEKGESPSPHEVPFFIHSRTDGDTQVYAQLRADYESNSLAALSEDASNLLRVSISKKS